MSRRNRSVILRTFGIRVRRLRHRKGLSQEELGFRSGIHRNFVGYIERGERSVSLETIQKIAKGLRMSLEKLFRGIR